MNEEHHFEIWVKPEIEELGNAKDLVAANNVVGGGDFVYSALNPS